MEETSLKKLVDVQGLSLALAKIKADYEAEISRASQNIVQSNWEQDDLTSLSYVQNRPAIRTGIGENSIIEGNVEDAEDAATYTIYVTGDANANEYTYTTEDTLPTGWASFGILYNEENDRYSSIYLISSSERVLHVYPTLSTTALTNAPIIVYYKCKSFSRGLMSHTEGKSFSNGGYSHAEGLYSYAYGAGSHAEGHGVTTVSGYSHGEGWGTITTGSTALASHVEGYFTIAASARQHVQGKYNIADSSSTYAHIVGNGTSASARSNAHTLDWAGNGWYAGKLTVGSAPTADMDVATKVYVDNLAATAEDDEEILNLLTEYGYSAPVADTDGNVVTDVDNNIILG